MGPRVNRRGNETLPLGQAGDCLPGHRLSRNGRQHTQDAGVSTPRLQNLSELVFAKNMQKDDSTQNESH